MNVSRKIIFKATAQKSNYPLEWRNRKKIVEISKDSEKIQSEIVRKKKRTSKCSFY